MLSILIGSVMVASTTASYLLNKRDMVKNENKPKEEQIPFYTAVEAKEKIKSTVGNVPNKVSSNFKKKDKSSKVIVQDFREIKDDIDIQNENKDAVEAPTDDPNNNVVDDEKESNDSKDNIESEEEKVDIKIGKVDNVEPEVPVTFTTIDEK